MQCTELLWVFEVPEPNSRSAQIQVSKICKIASRVFFKKYTKTAEFRQFSWFCIITIYSSVVILCDGFAAYWPRQCPVPSGAGHQTHWGLISVPKRRHLPIRS